MTSDSATGVSLPPDERPLGIQQPFLPSLPLGQSVLQPKFLTPLGARSLTVLDPNLFSADSAALGSDPGLPFQDSPFFDGPRDRAESPNIATVPLPSPSQSPPPTTLQPKLENPPLETEGSLPTGDQRFESGEPPSANGSDFVEWEQPAAIAPPEPTVEPSTSTPAAIQPKLASQPIAPEIQMMREVSGFEMPARSPETPSFPVEDQQSAIASPEPTFESPTLETIQPKLESQAIEPTIQAVSEVSGFEMPARSPEASSLPIQDQQSAIASPEPTFESSTSNPETIQPKLESQPTTPTIQAMSEVSGFEMPERSPKTPSFPVEAQQGAISSPEPTFESSTSTPETIQPKLESQPPAPTIQAMSEVSGFEMPARSPEASSLPVDDQQNAIAFPEPTFESPTSTPETIQPKLESPQIEPTIQAMSEVSGFEIPERSAETPGLAIENQPGAIALPEPTFESPTSTPETIQPKLESPQIEPTIQAESEVSGFNMSERSPETSSLPIEDQRGAIASPEPTFESSTSSPATIQPQLESPQTEPTIQAASEVSGFEMPERSPEASSLSVEDQQGAIASPEPTFESSMPTPETIQPKLESQAIEPTIQAMSEVSGFEMPERSPEIPSLPIEDQQGAIALPEPTFESPTSTPETIQPKLEAQPTEPMIQAMNEVSGFDIPERSLESSSSPIEDQQGAIALPEPTFESLTPTPTPETIQPKLEAQLTEPTIQASGEVSGFEMPARSPETSSPPIEDQQGAIASPEPAFESFSPTPETIQPKLESQPTEPTIQAMSEVSGFGMPERSSETPSFSAEDRQDAIALPEPTFESPAATSDTIQPKLESPQIEPTIQSASEVSGLEMPERSPETPSFPVEDRQGAIAPPEPTFESPTPTPETIRPKLDSSQIEPTTQAASEISEFEMPERSPETSSLPIEDQQGEIASPEPTFESPTPTPETIQPKLESPQIEPTIQAASEVSGFEMPERSPEIPSLPIEDQQGAIALPETTSELSTSAVPSTLQPKSDTQLITPQQTAPEPSPIEETEPTPSTTTSALPELPATLQRLSVWEPLIQTQPLNAAIAPHLTPPDLQPALAIPTADRTSPSDRTSTTEPAAAFEPFSLASDRASNATSSSPAPSEWSSIAELFQADSSSQANSPSQANSSSQINSPPALSPDITPGDGYTDLRLYPDPNASAPATVQRELATGDAIAAPPPSNSPTPEQASGESPAPTSPEQLEQLAQAVYRLVRQRLALERERGGHPPPGRFS